MMDYEACDTDYLEEQAILRGQALCEAWETEFSDEYMLEELQNSADEALQAALEAKEEIK